MGVRPRQPRFSLMHEAIAMRPSMEPPVLMDSCIEGNHEPVAEVVFSGGGGSSSPGSGAGTRHVRRKRNVLCVYMCVNVLNIKHS